MSVGYYSSSAGELAKVLETQLPLLLNKMVQVFSRDIDPLFRALATSSGVEVADGGRDYVVRKLFLAQGSVGNIEMQQSPTWLYGQGRDLDTLNRQWTLEGETLDTYPDPLIGVMPKHFQLTLPLNVWRGSFALSMDMFRAQKMESLVGEVINPILRGFVQNLLFKHCALFYTTDANYAISGVVSSVAGGGASHNFWEFVPDASHQRFNPGDILDIYTTNNNGMILNSTNATGGSGGEPSAANENARITCVVASVDGSFGTNGKVRVRLVPSGSTWLSGSNNPAGVPASTIRIFYRKGRNRGIAGIESWLRTSGHLLNSANSGINVNDHPEFRSLGVDGGGGPLYEHLARQIITRFNNAYGQYGYTTKVWIMSTGMFNAYVATKIGQEQRDRTNSPLNLMDEGTSESIVIVHEGVSVRIETSNWSAYGKFYGINWDAWKRYVPPSRMAVPKAGSGGGPSIIPPPAFAEIEPIGRQVMYSSDFVPLARTTSSGITSPTNFFHYPVDSRMTWCPTGQIPGIVGSNFAEQRLSGNS